MAASPAHRLGQILGEILEIGVEDMLTSFAKWNGLFLDKKGPRPARRGRKVSWTDMYGNAHDLDYVLEKGGGPSHIGVPVAFIEAAWRNYTKHSRAKAQEIQGAVLPVVDHHRMVSPFTGVVLGGVFTSGALKQLESLGFTVLFFPLPAIIDAFASAGLDIAFHEKTSLEELTDKVWALEQLQEQDRRRIAATLFARNAAAVATFMGKLEQAVMRQVESVIILPLHGSTIECPSISEAISSLREYGMNENSHPFRRFEILVRFSNGNRVEGSFEDRESAIRFVEMFDQPHLRPPSSVSA